MKDNPIAKSYADSLFEVSLEKKLVDTIGEDINAFAELMEVLPEFEVFLSSPSVETENKILVLQTHFEEKLHPITLRFLLLLLKRERFLLFSSIFTHFTRLLDAYLGKMRVLCITATALTESTEKKLHEVLSKKYPGKKMVLTKQIQPELLGGFVLEMDGKIVDASLKHKLSVFHKRLLAQTNVVLNK
ncbi:MAG: ATP synthase F1 subunit delta [Planctomycetota bacterium]